MSLDHFWESPCAGRAVLVVGMHRSGTSSVAGVLNILGVDFGVNLISPAKDNPKGFWEDSRIVAIHEALLESLGRTWDDFRPLPDGWLDFAATRSAAKELKEVIASSFSCASLWGVKDPRLSRFLPLWFEVLRELDVLPLVVLCFRRPEAVAESLFDRNGISEQLGKWLWVSYNSEVLLHSEGAHRVLVNYDRLLEDWQHELRLSMGEVLLTSRENNSHFEEIENFLTKELRHYNSSFSEGADEVGKLAQFLEDRDWRLAADFAKTINGAPNVIVDELLDYKAKEFFSLKNELHKVLKDVDHLSESLEELNSWSELKDKELGEALDALSLKEGQLEKAVAYAHRKENELDEVLEALNLKEGQLEEAVAYAHRKENELGEVLEALNLKEGQLEEAVAYTHRKENELGEVLEALNLKEGQLEETVAYARRKENELGEVLEALNLKEGQLEEAVAYGRRKENELGEALGLLASKEEELRCFESLREEIKNHEEKSRIIEQGFHNQILILNEKSMSLQRWSLLRRAYFWIYGLVKGWGP